MQPQSPIAYSALLQEFVEPLLAGDETEEQFLQYCKFRYDRLELSRLSQVSAENASADRTCHQRRRGRQSGSSINGGLDDAI